MKLIITISLYMLLVGSLQAQVHVSGFVRDSITRELLVGAHVIDKSSLRAITTDNNGYFNIYLRGNKNLTFSFTGYTALERSIKSTNDTLIEVLLSPGNQIDAVVVSHARRVPLGVSTMSQADLQMLPSLGAKPDVMKALQLLPGVQSQNEGSSLIMVRGGNPGENLYLLDNVALIYVNHLGGFMSVFNPDMINSIDVYKGGFPARYGGKLSSIMDITQREGNPSYTRGTLSIGVTDVSGSVEGPTPLANTTFFLTGRKTLTEPLMMLVTSLIDDGNYTYYYGFHDVNGKLTWRPNSRNTFSINLYHGDDYLTSKFMENDNQVRHRMSMKYLWGNGMVSARWRRVHTPRLLSTQSLSYVRYRLKQNTDFAHYTPNEEQRFFSRYESSVRDLTLKSGWRYELHSNWTLNFGLQSSLQQHDPNSIITSESQVIGGESATLSTESAFYIENQLGVPGFTDLTVGVRGVGYLTQGYSHLGIEPRVNLDLHIASNSTVNISYMKVMQFSHLLFTAGTINSSEIWVPSGRDVAPAYTHQVTTGLRNRLLCGMFDTEINIYHKSLNSLAAYREGIENLLGDGQWRSKLVTGGTGTAYGVELLIRKNHGSWKGFVSYTRSRTTRQFDAINNGQEYLFEYDRPQTASISVSRKLSNRLNLSAAWVYQTGLPFTPAIGRHWAVDIESSSPNDPTLIEALAYGERNSERMRNYHRLDLALQYKTYTRYSGYLAEWTFALYNAYNRRNPYFYYYNSNKKEGEGKALSLYQNSFFPIIPTISYKVFFDREQRLRRESINKQPWLRRLLYH